MFVRLAGLVWPFWSAGFHWTEGSRWLRQAEDWSQEERTVESVRVRVGLGNLLLWLGDNPAAAAVLNDALVISDGLDTVSPLDRPDVMLGVAAQIRGDLDQSLAWYDRALAAHRALVDSDPRALPVVGFMINLMAWVDMHRDDVRHAETLAREALAIERRLGLDGEASRTLALLGFIAIARDQVGEATRLFRESLDLAWVHHDLQQLVSLFTEHAEFDRKTGHSARAAVLLGAGSQLRTLLGGYPAEWLVSIERLTDEIRARLGDGLFLEHWQAGRDLPLDAAVTLARQVEIPPPPAIPAGLTQRGITTREREVLCLLADGRTDREIADALFLGRRTVHTHVSRLLAKLGVPNRRQAIAVARAEHLLAGCPSIRP
jgi:DNA-binding CsgD family transcriptional regulator